MCLIQYVTVVFNIIQQLKPLQHSAAQCVPLQYLFGKVLDEEGGRGVHCRGPLCVALLTNSYLHGQGQCVRTGVIRGIIEKVRETEKERQRVGERERE
jgi:hypothetical protein